MSRKVQAKHERDGAQDGGQALGLVVMSVALVAVIAVALSGVGARMVARSRAQNAADAAALAGVHSGSAAAANMAERNGAAIVSFAAAPGPAGTTVTVEVVLQGEHAIAAASDEP